MRSEKESFDPETFKIPKSPPLSFPAASPRSGESVASLARMCGLVHGKLVDTHNSGILHWALLHDCLIFSGSDSLLDWSYNLRLWPLPSPTGPGSVHAGMLSVARYAWREIKATVLGKSRIRIVAGYSLGAGVACLVAEKLHLVQVVGFATPAIGDALWADRFPHRFYDFRVAPDVLTASYGGRTRPRARLSYEAMGGWNFVYNHRHTLEYFS